MGTYATRTQARAAGITTAQADDARLDALLESASRDVDQYTGWWFEPRPLTLPLDGPGGPHLWLPAPTIALTSVMLDGRPLDLAQVLVYGTPSDGAAGNPKLMRLFRERWCKGLKNAVVVGSFGYVQPDLSSPPPPIVEATLRLVVRSLAQLTDAEGQAELQRTRLTGEVTDGHSYQLGGMQMGAPGAWRLNGWTGDPQLDLLLLRYRRPPHGGAP